MEIKYLSKKGHQKREKRKKLKAKKFSNPDKRKL